MRWRSLMEFIVANIKSTKGKSYKSVQFPDTWQFSRDLDAMLNIDFWE
jgi:hypothetical protein